MSVALVTGASRGIGKACAVALASGGFDVAVTARTVQEGEGVDDSNGRSRPLVGSLATTAALIEQTGRRPLAVPADLLDQQSLVAAVTTVLDEWGAIDVLVNNAVDTGPGSMDRIVDLGVPVLERKLAANAVAPLVLVQQVLPGMLDRGAGTIINVTSHVATNDPTAPAGEGGWGLGYAMSKGAFHRIAGMLVVELGDRGIRAYNVDPGFVLTERMLDNQRRHGFEGRYRGAPPSAIGSVVAWLAAGADKFVADAGQRLGRPGPKGRARAWPPPRLEISCRLTSPPWPRPPIPPCSPWKCNGA